MRDMKSSPQKLYGAENPQFDQNVTIFRKCNCDVVNSSSNFTKLCNCHFYVELLYHAYRQHDLEKSGHQPHPSGYICPNKVLTPFEMLSVKL